MQEKSMNKALLVYKAHQKQPSINDLTVTDKTDNIVTNLTNTQPYIKETSNTTSKSARK
jgi:hypothetical protein